MTAYKSAILIGISQIFKILFGLMLFKLISIYLGPEGLGKLGHFITLITFLFVFSGGGIQNAIVKYVSEYRTSVKKMIYFLRLSISYSLIFSITILIVFLLFSKQISFFVFNTEEYYYIIIFLSFIHLFMTFNNFIKSVANGFKETGIFVKSEILGIFFAIPVVYFLIKEYQFIGAIYSLFIIYLGTFIPSFYFYIKSIYSRLLSFSISFNYEYSKLYLYSLMTLVTAIVWPIVEIIIRQMIIDNDGYELAGIWQASLKLSHVYLGFFGIFLASYFVPTISPEKNLFNIKNKILIYSLYLFLLYILGAIVFYIFKNFFIELLFSSEFILLSDVIHLQLIGDMFKILSFIIGFVYVAKAFVKLYVVMEIIQAILLIIISKYFYLNDLNFISIYQAYVVSNIIFYVITLIVAYKYFKRNNLCL